MSSSGKSKVDPRFKNLLIFLVLNVVLPVSLLVAVVKIFNITDFVWLLGIIVILLIVWRVLLSIYRRLLLPTKQPLEYGRWAIVTGSTSGIGKDFAAYLIQQGMSLYIISRTESKLQQQVAELQSLRVDASQQQIRHRAFDFGTPAGAERDAFYAALTQDLSELNSDGGVGLLVNNVGTANEHPKYLHEFTAAEAEQLVQCNIMSVLLMTHTVLPFMQQRRNGGVISISSGSGNHPAPLIAIYSATKAFMTQFTRSMKVENWDSGVDFYVCTPFYIVSNLYKRKSGNLISPMPIALIKGTMQQLGKKHVLQGHGYWFHGFVGNVLSYYPFAITRNYRVMLDNRKRYDDRQAAAKDKAQ